ncbi:hypothetical protein Glove_54g94 [Diversispora epigaea]|uniref:Uncharacterized protein n=1 Tax=Diversispora epigaea TaxID=1348612 RepID=A0A397JCN2_9GLOM|nr:hypothetical protein Glove_54g94 [Diversispora epigaea]
MRRRHFGGDLVGQNYLGDCYCYRNGIGTIKDEMKAINDKNKAFQWYMKSAEEILVIVMKMGMELPKMKRKHFSDTRNQLKEKIVMHRHHLEITIKIKKTKDEEKIFQWYLKSNEERNSDGQNKLGYCYLLGIGTTKDDGKAFQYLANCYFYGIGTTKDNYVGANIGSNSLDSSGTIGDTQRQRNHIM